MYIVSTANWHLPRALPMTEQEHLTTASAEIEPCAAIATEGVQGEVRHCVLPGIWGDRSSGSWVFLGIDFMISVLVSPYI